MNNKQQYKVDMIDPADEEFDVFFGIINRFIGYFSIESQKESCNDSTCEYPFVAMDTRQMFNQIQLVANHLRKRGQQIKSPSFIDIGCGIGNVILVAEQMEFEVFGIEKDPYPYKIARKLMGEEKVAPEDIWNYKKFGDFDVIYYFRPFHDGKLQRKFEHMIEDTLKTGGVLIANRKMSQKIETDDRFHRLHADMPVWQKI